MTTRVPAKDGTVLHFRRGTSPDAVRLAMTAYDDAERWGGLGKQILAVIGKVAEAGEEGRRLVGEGLIEHPAARIPGKVVAAPLTGMGLEVSGLPALYGLLTGTKPRVAFGDNAIQFLNTPASRPYTMGNVQVYPPGTSPNQERPSYSGAVIRRGDHEAAHTYQAERDFFFGPRWLAHGGGVATNPYELEADRMATEIARRRLRKQDKGGRW